MTRLIDAKHNNSYAEVTSILYSADNQPSVELHVLQGDRPMAMIIEQLVRFHLNDIPPAQRGVPQIEVSFDIDANGIINVKATDKATGKEQSIRIEASSGLSDAEIEKMRQEAEANADEDNKKKEEIETLNKADGMIFQTEKQMKEFGDKIPEDKKQPIEEALAELKTAHEAKDVEAVGPALEKLESVFQAASQDMYAQPEGGAEGQDPNAQAGGAADGAEEVTDVDFEEVEEEAKVIVSL